MTDLAKTADLVLLMVDASYGFEMETFEFLNQLQLHGFPKVVGALSHLDAFKANKSLQVCEYIYIYIHMSLPLSPMLLSLSLPLSPSLFCAH